MRVVVYGVGALIAGAILSIGVSVALQPQTPSGRFEAAGIPCGNGDIGTIAIVARTPVTKPLKAAAGFRVESLGVGDPELQLLVGTEPEAPLAVPLDTVAAVNGPVPVGRILALPGDKTFQSCHYRLDDNPVTAKIASDATKAMLEDGLLTADELAAASTTFVLSDDPTKANNLLFFVIIRSVDSEAPARTVGASINRSNQSVISVGSGNIYDAAPKG